MDIYEPEVSRFPLESFRARFFVALGYRDFRQLWMANASAQAAAWALIVTRGWLIFDKTGSSFWVGAATFAAMGPQFVVPPVAGVLADRLDRRTILAWTYSLNLAHNIALLGLALFGGLEVWTLVVLSLVNGTARAAQLPTSQALAASLVPREHLLNALSLNASTQHASRLVGPGIVTPLLSVFGPPAAFFMCTLLYAVGLVQILSLRPQPPDARTSQEGILANFVGGLTYVYMRPLLRFVIMLAILHCALTMGFESLLPGFSHERLSAGSQGFGELLIAVGAGSLVASVLVSGVRTTQGRGNTILLMGVMSGVGEVMLSLTSMLWLAMVAAAIMGGAQAAFMTMAQATTQSLAADEFRGRVASINTFSLGGAMAILNLTNGSLAEAVGAHNILRLDGLLFVVFVLLGLFVASGRRAYGRSRVLEPQLA
jgi:MFS family permease